MGSSKPFFIVAHRGGKGPHAENTLEAFQHALASGATAIEMDVQLDHFRKRFYLEHAFLPTRKDKHNLIEKVLPFLPKEATIFVDFKTLSFIFKRYAIFFLKILKKYSLQDRAIFISFNPFVLLHLRKLVPSVKIGQLVANRLWALMFRLWIYRFLKPQFLILHLRILNRPRMLKTLLDFARKHKIQVLFFTANQPKDLQKVMEVGADGIITDYPEKAAMFHHKLF